MTTQEDDQHLAKNILEIYGERALREVCDWCDAFAMRVVRRASDHIVELEYTPPQAATTAAASPAQQLAQSAEKIFAEAMQGDGDTPAAPRVRCSICARIGHAHEGTCAYQCLILCPDAILARCARSAEDTIVREYLIVHRARTQAPILNLNGKWSFDMIRKLNFSKNSLQGFVTLRTFVMCNIARIVPPTIAIASKPTVAPASSSPAIFKLIRKASKRGGGDDAQSPAGAPRTPFYVIRTRLRSGIRFYEVETIKEAILTHTPPPICVTDEVIETFERDIANIFAQESDITYSSAHFAPRLDAAPTTFNYWRGWSNPPLPAEGIDMRGTVMPILTFINEVWCGNSTRINAPCDPRVVIHDNSPIPLCESARFVVSWFAHIVQQPGNAPERQLVMRGFQAGAILPLLRFIGTQVIGEQYFDEPAAATQESVAHLRDDCLLAFIAGAPITHLKKIMRECRGLWHLQATSKREKLISHNAFTRDIDMRKRIKSAEQTLLRVVVQIGADYIPIPAEKRRFVTIEAPRGPDALRQSQAIEVQTDAITRMLGEAMNLEGAGTHFFNFLARYEPLTLNWG